MEQQVRKHNKSGEYLKDVVYGANDGVITTFAVVAGVAGAGLDSAIVVLLGLANLLADGFSMAASNYLGSKSERDYVMRERDTEEMELHAEPKREHTEMFGYLRRKGYAQQDAKALLSLLSKNKSLWLDIMSHEELGISPPNGASTPVRAARATFFSFVFAGAVPLIPYMVFTGGDLFSIASWSTAVVLFTIGAARSLFTDQRWYTAGFEMLCVGGTAALIAYSVGYLLSVML
ncbi:MAG: hypothetical protein G01um101429_86 [Parcubacteria group bacterium Gr01-1014_29]|nr:MAG: hypothetical protein G01um101429_86 [Parcubacteria group bacterium Gr01-1014_29]